LRGGDVLEDWKIRLTLLWLFMAVATSAMMVLILMTPGFGEEIVITHEFEGMELNEGLLLMMALFWWIPLVLALLSLTQKDSLYRWASIIGAVFFVVWSGTSSVEHLTLGRLSIFLMEASKLVVAVLIIWFAWKSKQAKA